MQGISRMIARGFIHGIALIGLLAGGALPATAASFGPGAHWVDTVTADTDVLPTVATLEFVFPDGGVETLSVSGSTSVSHSGAVDTPDPLDPGHLNAFTAEILSTSLAGMGPSLGPIWLVKSLSLPSSGLIREQPLDPGLADSFFDVFFDVQVMGLTLHNSSPHRIAAVIDRYPPFGEIFQGGDPVDLVDQNGRPTGSSVQVKSLTLVPEASTLVLLAAGLLGIAVDVSASAQQVDQRWGAGHRARP